MRNIGQSLSLVLVLLFLFTALGCRVRTYTVEKPRVDLKITGNQGYLAGQPAKDQDTKADKLSPTRKISVLEVDVGPKDKNQTGSQKITATQQAEEGPSANIMFQEPQEDEVTSGNSDGLYKEEIDQPGAFKVYTVQEKDTLQKISKKFFGTTKKWQDLYNANKDVLPTPDKIYPGQKIKIPLEK